MTRLLDMPPMLAASDGFFAWLLGLRRIDPAMGDVVLGWRHPLPLWLWVLIVLAAGAIAWFSYRRLLGARAGRVALAAARAGVLVMIALLLAGPMLVLPRENVEPDRVLMLLDRSASMSVRDAPAPRLAAPAADPGGDGTSRDSAGRPSRNQQLQRLLRNNESTWQRLADEHRIEWLGFSDRLAAIGGGEQAALSPRFDRESSPGGEEGDAEGAANADEREDPGRPSGSAPILGPPTGPATALRTGLQQAIRRAAGKPVSAVVVFSDGRSSQPLGPETWRLLQQAGVSVWTVPLGSPDAPADLAIERVEAPDRAFVEDTVPITATISRTGGAGGKNADASAGSTPPAPPGTALRLIDRTTGEVLDRRPVRRFNQPIRLMTTPQAAGKATWRLELTTAGPELIERNNRRDLELTFVDRPIRLLYVEGYPRWQYRYLKNLVVRESSVESSIMLLSADRQFAQEGDVPLDRLPRSAEEMRPYDVVIIGDVPADQFTAEQIKLIREQVSRHAAGLMWMGGPRHTPRSYAASALSPLLPVGAASGRLPAPIVMRPTPLARALGVLQLRTPGEGGNGGEAESAWPDDLPPLRWAQSIESLKPAAEPLAIDAGSEQPLVVRMRFGAGQTLLLATDEMWRWRYGRGELYGQQFWMQLIRLMARGRLKSDGGPATLTVSHQRAATGETLVVELDIHDPTLLSGPPEPLDVAIQPVATGTPAARNAPRQIITLTPTDRPDRYRGMWTPRTAGRSSLTPAGPALANLGLEQIVRVERPDAEMRNPAADHPLLAELAQRSGGGVLTPDRLASLDQIVPNRARRSPADISEALWHSPLAFALLALLLTGEWIGRRMLGLA